MKKLVPTDAVLIPDNAERVFRGKIFDVYQWPQTLFDGSKATFEMLRRPDTVVTIGVDGNTIIVLDDEQPNRGRKRTFPGGRADVAGESVLDAAKRETHEETGLQFDSWRLISVYQPVSKIEWFIYVFVAHTVVARDTPHLDAGERITIERLSFDDTKQLVVDKASYMHEARDIFEVVKSCDELLELPEFLGQEIER